MASRNSFLSTIANLGRGIAARWGGTGGGRLRLLLPGSSHDYEREAGDLWRNAPVGIALHWLGNQIARPRLVVNRIDPAGDYEPIPNHDIVRLWRRPNPYYTGRTLGRATVLSLACEGDCFWYKVRGRGGKVEQLWWLPPFDAAPLYPDDGSEYLSGWQFHIDGTEYRLPAADVVHLRIGIDPHNDRRGLSPLKAALRELVTLNEAASYSAALLKNMGIPGLIIAPEGAGRFDRGQDELMKQKLEQGFNNDDRGRTLVATSGVKVTSLGLSPEQMRLEHLPRPAQSAIVTACGLNPMALGLPDPDKTYSNYAESIGAAWRNGVVPVAEAISDGIQIGLLPEFEDPELHEVGWDWDDIEALQEDLGLKHQRVREDYAAGLIEKNEGRELLGFDPHPDGDVFVHDLAAVGGSLDDLEGMFGTMGRSVQTKANGKAHACNGHDHKRWSY